MMDANISLPHNADSSDNRPLPLIVAEIWKFPLRVVVDGDTQWYSIRDWMAGLTGRKDPKDAWLRARKAQEMQSVLERVREYPYGTGTSQFIDDKGLYTIAVNLRAAKGRTVLPEIKAYLAKSGAFLDLIRRDPQVRAELGASAGPEALLDATVGRYRNMGRDDDWIHARLESVIARKEFTDALKLAVLDASKDLYWKSTETVYSGLWKRTTAQLRGELDLKPKDKLRDHFGEYALIYTRLAEKVAADKLKDAETVHEQLAMDIVYTAAKLIYEQAQATSKALGIDLVTEKPLLSDGQA